MKERYTETHNTWNKIAQLYEDRFMELELYNETYQAFCDLLPKNASVLEIGCGPGNITKHLLNLNPDLEILATDVSRNMIGLAQKNNPSIDVQLLDCRDMGKITRTFDGIVCGFTIPYLEKSDLIRFIADCAQSLNENGVLYLSFVEGNYEDSGFISGSSGDRTYFYYYGSATIQEALEVHQIRITDQYELEYQKADGSMEVHMVINGVKTP